jgi:hypothetical protein
MFVLELTSESELKRNLGQELLVSLKTKATSTGSSSTERIFLKTEVTLLEIPWLVGFSGIQKRHPPVFNTSTS